MKEVKAIETEYQGRRVFTIDVSKIDPNSLDYYIREMSIRFDPKKRRERNLKTHTVDIAQLVRASR